MFCLGLLTKLTPNICTSIALTYQMVNNGAQHGGRHISHCLHTPTACCADQLQ